MVGRGCLGRPWLFTDLQAVFAGRPPPPPPQLGTVVSTMDLQLREWVAWENSERSVLAQMRKFVPLYLMGYSSAQELQRRLLMSNSLEEWDDALSQAMHDGALDASERPDASAARRPRLKGSTQPSLQRVSLPEGWLLERYSDVFPEYLSEDACEG